MSERFGLPTSIALGVGGIVGGGIYAAIGIVVAAAGVLTWLSYAIATVVVLCAAYSYTNMNEITDNEGGSVSYIGGRGGIMRSRAANPSTVGLETRPDAKRPRGT